MTLEVIHYGFGKNMWDITPLNHITMMYKVSFICLVSMACANHLLSSFIALLRLRPDIQDPNFSRQNLGLSIPLENLPKCLISLYHLHNHWPEHRHSRHLGLDRLPSVHPGPFGLDRMGTRREREMH